MFCKGLGALFIGALWAVAAAAGSMTWYVDVDNASGTENGTSWGTAFTSINDAVAAATAGDNVWVAEGTYDGLITIPSSVRLFGGFAGTESNIGDRDVENNETTINGQGFNAVTAGNLSRLDGFTIVLGQAVDGGALYCDGVTMTVANCRFTGNSATSGDGGAAAVLNGSNVTFEFCYFENNSAASGGAVRVDNSMFRFNGCEFFSNSATTEGGAVSTDTMSSGSFMNCDFVHNSSQVGGAVSLEDSTTTISDCRFAANDADGGGGLVNVMASTEIVRSTFTGNTATTGGGIGGSQSMITITDTTLSANKAQEGGGLYADGGTTSILESAIEANIGTNQSGGLHFASPTNAQLKDSIVRGNTCITGAGGGLGAVGGLFVCERVKFFDNSAETSGGAVITSSSGQVFIVNSLFVRNSTDQGGAVALGSGTTELTNCTFTQNSGAIGASAVWNNNGSTVDALNIVSWGNFGAEDVGNAGTLNIDFSNTESPEAGLSNISEDPLFFDPANDDYRLMVGSPSIDSGVVQKGGATTPTNDIRKEDRPQGGGMDMGAYEAIPDEDSDGDGLPDSQEGTGDTDGDGIVDYLDPDSDNDGLRDGYEADNNLDPLNDSDGGGVDSDNDGLINAIEQGAGTDATGLDSDSDGVLDPFEIAFRTDPNDDQDGPQLANDDDGDGLPNGVEILVGAQSDEADSDGDGIDDGLEVVFGLQPNNPDDADDDPDNDGLTNAEEINTYKTDPNEPDTDGDGVNDGDEVTNGSDPLGDRLTGDVNNDGVVDAVDVQLTINGALGVL